MGILERVNIIRSQVKQLGNYQLVAENSGVSYHWLNKFAVGKIVNPTIDNVAKLELFFKKNKHLCIIKTASELPSARK
jgi:hypothetical protein